MIKNNSIKFLDADALDEMAETLKVIAHPKRIAILGLLEDGGSLTVTEIHEKLDMNQSPTSHHLKLLKTRGLVSSKREGKQHLYSINKDNLSSVLCCFKRCTDQ